MHSKEQAVSRYTEDTQLFALSPYQLGIYIEHNRSDNAARAYTTPVFLRIDGAFDVHRATKAFFLLVKRHKILTGFIKEQDGRVFHHLTNNINVSIEEISSLDLDNYLQKKSEKIMSLSHCLVDFSVIDVVDKEELVVLSLTHHHLVADGYAIELMIRDYFEFYESLANDKPGYNYYSYVAQHQTQPSRDHWLQKPLHNSKFTIPSFVPRPALRSFSGQYRLFDFDPLLQLKIQKLSAQNQCSLNIIVLTCLYVALAKVAQDPMVTLGVAFANRRPDSEAILGSLVNVLPVTLHINADHCLSGLFASLAQTIKQAVEHCDFPAIELLNTISRDPEVGFHPLYQILFVAQEEQTTRTATSYKFTRKLIHNKTAKFDLAFHFHHDAKAHSLGIEYSDLLYDSETIERIWGLLSLVIDSSVEQEKLIAHIPLVNKKDYQQLIHTWNKTDADYPHTKTLHQLFEEQALRTPNNIALVFEHQKLTYQELNEQSNQLARFIQKHQQSTLSSNNLVALYLDRSLEMLIGILAILKAGNAYVPIDPSYPIDRVRYLLEDTKSDLILTSECFIRKLQCLPANTAIFALDTRPYQGEDVSRLNVGVQPEDLAYVMYTSGTTGHPKGVLISHRGIVNRIDWMQKHFQ